jgi:flagellar export protein FliJ
MKRHVFSLNRVLRVRTTQEAIAKEGLRSAVRHAMAAEEDYDTANRRYQAGLAAQASVRGSVMGLMALRDLDTMRGRAVVEADQHREEARVKVEAEQELWMAARQKVAALERLDERQREEHARAVLKEQDAEADDVVTTRPRVLRDDLSSAAGLGGVR